VKQLTLVPEGGLCNRIYAITSAIGFAKKHNLRLTVYWFKGWGMGAGFHDLFTLSPAVENVKIKDAGFIDFFKYAKPVKSNLFLPKLYQKFRFDAVYYWYKEQVTIEKWYFSKLKADKFYLFTCRKFYESSEFAGLFSPVNSIQKRISERLNLLTPNTIGIHIRRTDHSESIAQSPLSAFVRKMQQEIATNPETDFYIASDSPEEKKSLTDSFGNRIITVANNLKRNTKNGVVDALIELYTLASTKKIYGSFQSTYSLFASEINGKPIEIVVTDTK